MTRPMALLRSTQLSLEMQSICLQHGPQDDHLYLCMRRHITWYVRLFDAVLYILSGRLQVDVDTRPLEVE